MSFAKISVLVLAVATLGICIEIHGQVNTIGGFSPAQNVYNQFDNTRGFVPGNANGFYENNDNAEYHPPTGNTVQDFVNSYRAAQTPKRDFVPIHEPRQEPAPTMQTFPPFQAKIMQKPMQDEEMQAYFQVAAPFQSMLYKPYHIANLREPVWPQQSTSTIPIVEYPTANVKSASATPVSYQYSSTKYGDDRKPNMFSHSNAYGENSQQFGDAKRIYQQLASSQGAIPLKDLTYDQLATVSIYKPSHNSLNGFNTQRMYESKPVANNKHGVGYGYNMPVWQNSGKNQNPVGHHFGNYDPKLGHDKYTGYSSANALTDKNNRFGTSVFGQNLNEF